MSHRKLSTWYHQLARQLEAGLPLPAALQVSRGTGFPDHALDAIVRALEAGEPIAAALRHSARWLPASDREMLAASAEVGRMPHLLHSLSARHAGVAAARMRLLLACVYPLAVLHFGLLLLPLAGMFDWEKGFTWDAFAYARGLGATLVPLWALGALFVGLGRAQNGLAAAVALRVPLIGRYLREQGLADFAFSLGSFVQAGLRIDRAWQLAGAASTQPGLKHAAKAMQTLIAQGISPGRRLHEWRCFPPDFVALYQNGENTGHLDEQLLRIAAEHQERGGRALALATVVYPGVVFLAVAGVVVYHVVRFYAGYFRMIEGLAS